MTTPPTTMQELARRWVHDHDEEALAEYCQREAARLDAEETMTEPSTAPTTFEVDWLQLGSTMLTAIDTPTPYGGDHTENIVRAVITAYQRQMAEAGYVVVRKEDMLDS